MKTGAGVDLEFKSYHPAVYPLRRLGRDSRRTGRAVPVAPVRGAAGDTNG